MFAITITSLVVGFAIGVLLAWRFLPPLATTREGVLATWLVRILFGLGISWSCLQVYYAIHSYVSLTSREAILGLGESRSDILSRAVSSILMPGALLVGLSAAIFLLAPTDLTKSPA